MVKIILFYSSVKSLDEFERQGFYVEDLRLLNESGYKVICTNKLIDFLKLNYDIAFLYFYKKSTLAAIVAKLRFKFVYFTGGIDDISGKLDITLARRLLFKTLFLISYLFSNRINVVSESDLKNASRLLCFLRFGTSKISLFPHSYPNLHKEENILVKKNIFFTMCWMSTIGNVKRKGLDKALHFFSIMCDILPDSQFYIIGALGEGSDYLKDLNVYEKIKDRVIFTGFLEEVEKNTLMNSAKYYLQFSSYEGFGLAALEANFFKCYVFHSGSGGFLSSNDIWGIQIENALISNKDFILDLFNEFDYEKDLQEFNLRYQILNDKFSSLNRMTNLKLFLNG